MEFGEGARPRAPRRCATTQRCIFVGDYITPSASVTTDREDAIPPGRGGFVSKCDLRSLKQLLGLRIEQTGLGHINGQLYAFTDCMSCV